jgi:hypothetical protein
MTEFLEILGDKEERSFQPTKIHGSGNIHQKKMWLNVRDVSGPGKNKGLMTAAINDWRDFAAVR